MIFSRYAAYIALGLAFLPVFSGNAHAGGLKEKLSTLEILSLKFGVNEFSVRGNRVIIIKGAHLSDAAGGGDTYQTLMEMKYPHSITKESPFWQSVAVHTPDSFIDLQQTAPHTYEDSLLSVRFMIKKNEASSKDLSSLYVLRSRRDFPGVLTDPSFVNLSLYTLKYPSTEVGDMVYFEPEGSLKTKKKYSSADCAAYTELGVELPAYAGKGWCLN